MRTSQLFLPAAALAAAAILLLPTGTDAYALLGGSLSTSQRDVRVFNNFTDPTANDNTTAHPNFPGYDGAEMAIWKACVEWGSRLHGDGNGDLHQPAGLGSGGANFDISWQGNATGVGTTDENIHSELSTSGQGGTLAYTESPISNGWRIRYLSNWEWADGPGTGIGSGRIDLQGVATHEYGHALGLDHTGVGGATMTASISGNGVVDRSIESDDINGVRAIYGVAAATKPIINGVSIPSPGTIEITGSNFGATGNEVWFTQAGTGGSGTPVKVLNALSNGGGTQMQVTIPGNAGPGDVLVKISGTGGATLSNAWPFDPSAGPSCTPTSFCATSPNSVGPGAVMGWDGSTSVTDNDFQLGVVGLPVGTVGLFYAGNQQSGSPVPFGNGLNCVTGPVLRFGAAFADSLGSAFFFLDFNSYPGTQMSANGTPWLFQFWYRNPAGGGLGFNTSDGIRTLWCP